MLVKNDIKSLEKINKETYVCFQTIEKKTRKRRLGVFFSFSFVWYALSNPKALELVGKLYY